MQEIRALKEQITKLRRKSIVLGVSSSIVILTIAYILRTINLGGLHPSLPLVILSVVFIGMLTFWVYVVTKITSIPKLLRKIDEIERVEKVKTYLGTEEKQVEYLYKDHCFESRILINMEKDFQLQYFLSMAENDTVVLKVKEKKTQKIIYAEKIANISDVYYNFNFN